MEGQKKEKVNKLLDEFDFNEEEIQEFFTFESDI